VDFALFCSNTRADESSSPDKIVSAEELFSNEGGKQEVSTSACILLATVETQKKLNAFKGISAVVNDME
jgi:hypothetical protein